jgi:hypothetical protein
VVQAPVLHPFEPHLLHLRRWRGDRLGALRTEGEAGGRGRLRLRLRRRRRARSV